MSLLRLGFADALLRLGFAELGPEQVAERTEALTGRVAAVVLDRFALVIDRERLRRAAQSTVAIDAEDLHLERAALRVALAHVAAGIAHLGLRHVAARATTDHALDAHEQAALFDAL